MEKRIPPYFQNFDGSHCLQCSLRSALEFFNPDKTWTWEELDALSGKQPDKPTWHMSFLSNVGILGYEVVCIENFNLSEFVVAPQEYLKKTQSPESYAYTMAHIDFDLEVKASYNLLKAEQNGLAELHYRNHSVDDIRHYLKQGFVIIHWVNSRALSMREGFNGHFVFVYDILDDNKTLLIHDNGGLYDKKEPVGRAEQRVDIDFLLQCGTSGQKTGGFYAIRPKKHD